MVEKPPISEYLEDDVSSWACHIYSFFNYAGNLFKLGLGTFWGATAMAGVLRLSMIAGMESHHRKWPINYQFEPDGMNAT